MIYIQTLLSHRSQCGAKAAVQLQGRTGLLSYKYSYIRIEPEEPKINNTVEKPEEKERKKRKELFATGFPGVRTHVEGFLGVGATNTQSWAPQVREPSEQVPYDQKPPEQVPQDQEPPDQVPCDHQPTEQVTQDQEPSEQIPQDQEPSGLVPTELKPLEQFPPIAEDAPVLVPESRIPSVKAPSYIFNTGKTVRKSNLGTSAGRITLLP